MSEITFRPGELFNLVAFLLLVVGAFAVLRAGVLRQTLDAFKVQAEQMRAELIDAKTSMSSFKADLAALNRDHITLKEDHENLKVKYIEVLEENRRQFGKLADDVMEKLSRIELHMTKP